MLRKGYVTSLEGVLRIKRVRYVIERVLHVIEKVCYDTLMTLFGRFFGRSVVVVATSLPPDEEGGFVPLAFITTPFFTSFFMTPFFD